MHSVIRVIVDGSNEEQAVRNANQYFEDNLYVGVGGPFDYCTPMDSGHTVSGSDRWTEYEDSPPAVRLSSQDGRAEVEDAWSATVDRMDSNLEDIYELANEASNIAELRDELLDDSMVSFRTKTAVTGDSADTYLYMNGWNKTGIHSYKGLESVKEAIEMDENDESELWLVPLDVHF